MPTEPMKKLIAVQAFRDTYRVPKTIEDASLTAPVSAANTDIRRAVGQAVYDDASKDNNDATDEQRRNQLILAGMYLALYYAIPILNPRLTANGMLIEMIADDVARERLLSPNEMQKLRESLLADAKGLIEPYQITAVGANPSRGGAVGIIDPLNIDARANCALKGTLPWSNSRLPLI